VPLWFKKLPRGRQLYHLSKKIAFIINFVPPSQKALKLGLSAMEMILPVPEVLTITAAEFLPGPGFLYLAIHSAKACPCKKKE
jgi:hypothetical protein